MKSILILVIVFSFLSCNDRNKVEDQLNLKVKLNGSWKATAFDGELHEAWHLGANGWMQQRGYYIEKNDTSYSASTRIEKVDSDIILFSVIKNANPKIFKAINVSDKKIIFQNTDYKNPYHVTYEFIDTTHYKRTIKGYENDSLVVYEFNFKKID